MEVREGYKQLNNHIRQFFEGHQVDEIAFDGPILEVQPDFKVLCMAPGPKIDLWVYVSIGAWEFYEETETYLEFMILSPKQSIRCVELLAMTVYYHHTYELGIGHTLYIDEPWLEESKCDHFLISLPYPFNPIFFCSIGDKEIHICWLIPITKEEAEYKAINGLEALEAKFEEKELEYWRVDRPSVV